MINIHEQIAHARKAGYASFCMRWWLNLKELRTAGDFSRPIELFGCAWWVRSWHDLDVWSQGTFVELELPLTGALPPPGRTSERSASASAKLRPL